MYNLDVAIAVGYRVNGMGFTMRMGICRYNCRFIL